jgi:hypothetical protein
MLFFPCRSYLASAQFTHKKRINYILAAEKVKRFFGGMAYTMDSLSAENNTGMNAAPSMQQEIGSALAAQLARILHKRMADPLIF